jgi:DNA polymerase III epsilon subunit-like protein
LALNADILELSVRIIDHKEKPTDIVFESLIRPKGDIGDYSKEVCGFSKEELEKADLPKQVAYNFFEWKKEYFEDHIIPIGHNFSNFDRPRLQLFLGSKMYDAIFHYHIFDTMIISKTLIKAGFLKANSSSLKSVIKTLGIPTIKGFHRASNDTWYTGVLYNKLLRILMPNLLTRIIRVIKPTYSGV